MSDNIFAPVLAQHQNDKVILRLYVAVDRFPEWIEDTPTPEAIPRELLDQIVVLIVNVDRNQANPLHATTTKLSPSSILACYVQHEKPITRTIMSPISWRTALAPILQY